mmetsp:Transcript_142902/g.372252  ORF Transcript_142902/g.372252 Transcript_142902/m.372252 type:complete len:523 (-) Transcript_142902:36-1604(-)
MGNAGWRCSSCRSPSSKDTDADGEPAWVRLADDWFGGPGLGPQSKAAPEVGAGCLREVKTSVATAAEAKAWVLPPGGYLTVMMFGMTGAGKSSLGNLIAGKPVFATSDDTRSVTNLNSVMRYEADDASLVLMDTIGLGDTEIGQDAVNASIRDVALSAPCGVDVLLYVLRYGRITDDTIARLIYLTDFLWGRDCLPNLYVVITGASRYVNKKEESIEWINRQVERNWRFKHIYDLAGGDANRFVFIDNPGPTDEEENREQRHAVSNAKVVELLVRHTRAMIPPFTHAAMRQAQAMTAAELEQVDHLRREVKQLNLATGKKLVAEGLQLSSASLDMMGEAGAPQLSAASLDMLGEEGLPLPPDLPVSLNIFGEGPLQLSPDSLDMLGGALAAAEQEEEPPEIDLALLGKTIVELLELRAEALSKQGAANKALQDRLEAIKADPLFQQIVIEQAERATAEFAQAYAEDPVADPSAREGGAPPPIGSSRKAAAPPAGLVTACNNLAAGLTASTVAGTQETTKSPP